MRLFAWSQIGLGRQLFPRPSLRIVVLTALFVVGLLALNSTIDVDQDDLERAIDRRGILGPAVYAVILTLGLTVPFNPVSDILTITVAAIVLDPQVAILTTFGVHAVAVTVNYTVGYLYGHRLMDRVLERRDIPLLRRVHDRITVRSVFLLRFALPLTAIGIDWISYLAGAQRLRFSSYFIASMVPWTLMNVVYFSSAALLRETSPFLVLVPAVLIVMVTSLLVLLLRRKTYILDAPPGESAAETHLRR